MTHNSTHLDALYHFHSTINQGERAITIDEVPLEWCFQPGVKLGFRDFVIGNHFMLKPKGAPVVKVIITELVKNQQFVDRTNFLGAQMFDIHEG